MLGLVTKAVRRGDNLLLQVCSAGRCGVLCQRSTTGRTSQVTSCGAVAWINRRRRRAHRIAYIGCMSGGAERMSFSDAHLPHEGTESNSTVLSLPRSSCCLRSHDRNTTVACSHSSFLCTTGRCFSNLLPGITCAWMYLSPALLSASLCYGP